ncbi:M23 family metallopeptidase, partial [Arthrobacter vasquezii]|uniref:M23 family metallopeptidase n=1 Tax=Arthrobacter vasquezii TaxID=2977629 RepID=UPI003850A1DB
ASPVAPIAGAISAVGVLSGALLAGIPLTAAVPSSVESSAVSAGPGSVPQPHAQSIKADPKARVDFSRAPVPGAASSPEPATGSVDSSHLLADGPIQTDPGDDADEEPTTEPAVEPVEQAGLGAPLAQMSTVSTFGYRTNPLTGVPGEMHTGIDLTGSCSTPVMAAASGVITEAGWSPYGGGNRIVIDHGDGLKTTYNHLATIAVSVGQTATRGDVVGGVGTTGNSTGCHLHFEVMINDTLVDPGSWF